MMFTHSSSRVTLTPWPATPPASPASAPPPAAAASAASMQRSTAFSPSAVQSLMGQPWSRVLNGQAPLLMWR
jgi:hypothetical protein